MVPALTPVVTQEDLWLAQGSVLLQESKIRLGFLTVSGQRANNVYLNVSKIMSVGKRTNHMLHKWRRVVITS